MGYKGLSPNQKNYYVYLAFFMGEAGELYLKVGKTGSLKTRFIDLQKANPTNLYKAYVIDVGEIDEVADGMEYIFKRRLSPLNIHGEWFHVCHQTLAFLRYIMHIINKSQSYDEEIWEDDTFAEYFSIMGHRSEKDIAYEYDWDEILRHNNEYKLQPIDFIFENEIIIQDAIEIDELYDEFCELLENSTYQAPDEYVDLQPNFDFRDYFSREECGKERKDWWNYPLEYRDEFI